MHDDERPRYPLSDAACGVCRRPTVLRVLLWERGEMLRAPCCDSCAAALNDDRRALLVRAARDGGNQ